MTEFKAGDLVKIEGVLEKNDDTEYPLGLKVDDIYLTFKKDGRIHRDHKTPSIQMVKPAPRKVMKYKVVHKDRDGFEYVSANYYKDAKEFIRKCPSWPFIALVKELSKEFEE